ncbi:MAG TPA: Gfo/Idh/MocA family oxidoreductase [Thermoclostridium caenicola]|uniref:Gfo/Idh/MocA family protein n=1 Tax=Thermoclostridium caenicola TaxID=659425 RepID=UPI002D1B2A0B|nr:Gfo/Idh/MocA family oxidoreductase [Thermoclostridium caenicola]HOK43404.1 Gfo/Idh/MocA family oxidoreductase [Thermoclostridium caenicola]HOL83778.1 Gfo/Idh/MocA family oxidoreductase [Thermoclostridium caenicola]HPO75800.1 Gfo/Idh/MocA family oxidoreductase [Thermoclostridium caenicola]
MHLVYFGEVLAAGVPGLDSKSGYVWAPDAPDIVASRLAAGELAGVCDTFSELLEKSDAIMILTRDGRTHRKYAEMCIENHKPVFVDKPFACDKQDALAMIEAARKHHVPIMGGSTLCWLPETESVRRSAKDASEITIQFMADWESPYGGWYYYGSHLTDLCACVGGCDAKGFEAKREGRNVTASVFYDGLAVKLVSSLDINDLSFHIAYKTGNSQQILVPNYERCYRFGMERFSDMLINNQSVYPERLLFSVNLLDSIIKRLSK